jgi:hypothetical protein
VARLLPKHKRNAVENLARPLQHGSVVELVNTHRAGGRGVDAELAEDALVEVLLDDLEAPVAAGEDVDRAGVLELLGELGVGADLLRHLDVDEDLVELLAGHQATAFRDSSPALTASGMSSIRSTTSIPAA